MDDVQLTKLRIDKIKQILLGKYENCICSWPHGGKV